MSRLLLALAVLLGSGAAVAKQKSEKTIQRAQTTGIGASTFGGALVALDVSVKLGPSTWLQGSLGPRIGLGDDLYLSPALAAGVGHYFSTSRFRNGVFGRIGSTVPLEFFEVYGAGGYTFQFNSRTRKYTLTVEAGPGYFVVRDLPAGNADPSPFLLYLRIAHTWWLG